MKLRVALLVLGLALQVEAAQIALPIYIEDNHAGAFYWLAQHLDLEEPCTLLHFDAHTDASAIFNSDEIRQCLRRVDSLDQRTELLEEWRRRGVVQCFDWIEPLMPAPIAQVIWVPPNEQSDAEAIRQLDGHLEAAPRASGSFRSRFRSASLESLEKDFTASGPLIVSLDLDYFAHMLPGDTPTAFERVWKFICERRNLRAIVIAVSRPYLKDEAQANALVQLALHGGASLPTARVEFAPDRVVGNDRSLRARELRAQGSEVPRFRLTSHPGEPTFRLAIKNHAPSTDSIWRLDVSEDAEVEIRATPWTARFEKVQWFHEEPVYLRCNLVSDTDDGTLFGRGAPPRPRWREVETNAPLDKRLGVTRIKARIDGIDTSAIEVRRFAGTGFRAALTEQFGLPNLFGSGSLRDGNNTGPETGWGADCANFIVYALRRQGRYVPWSNPKQLRRYLEPVATNVSLGDGVRFSADELERGVILHLGSHVAALVEDRAPVGILNADDIVAHQLEAAPELIPIADLLRARGKTRFDLLRVPATSGRPELIIGGDVMLGRTIADAIEAGAAPFAGIADVLRGAETSLINLECVVSNRGVAEQKKYAFRAQPEAADTLKQAGVDVISVANNHALDFGPAALDDEIAAMRARGITVIGQSYAPQVFTTGENRRIALLGLNDVDAALSLEELAGSIGAARSAADFILVFVHWGQENTPLVMDKQRGLARWLIDHQVDLVVGSHPHCQQPIDYYHGRAIIYSLGNLVFDGAPTFPSWNKGALLQVTLGPRGAAPGLKLIPIELDRRGFPQLTRDPALSRR